MGLSWDFDPIGSPFLAHHCAQPTRSPRVCTSSESHGKDGRYGWEAMGNLDESGRWTTSRSIMQQESDQEQQYRDIYIYTASHRFVEIVNPLDQESMCKDMVYACVYEHLGPSIPECSFQLSLIELFGYHVPSFGCGSKWFIFKMDTSIPTCRSTITTSHHKACRSIDTLGSPYPGSFTCPSHYSWDDDSQWTFVHRCVRCQELRQEFPDRIRKVGLPEGKSTFSFNKDEQVWPTFVNCPCRWQQYVLNGIFVYWFGSFGYTKHPRRMISVTRPFSVPRCQVIFWESRNFHTSMAHNGTHIFPKQLVPFRRTYSAPAVWIKSCAQRVAWFSEDVFVHQSKLGSFKQGDSVSFRVWPPNVAGIPSALGAHNLVNLRGCCVVFLWIQSSFLMICWSTNLHFMIVGVTICGFHEAVAWIEMQRVGRFKCFHYLG